MMPADDFFIYVITLFNLFKKNSSQLVLLGEAGQRMDGRTTDNEQRLVLLGRCTYWEQAYLLVS